MLGYDYAVFGFIKTIKCRFRTVQKLITTGHMQVLFLAVNIFYLASHGLEKYQPDAGIV
jgi:hypothetical protein